MCILLLQQSNAVFSFPWAWFYVYRNRQTLSNRTRDTLSSWECQAGKSKFISVIRFLISCSLGSCECANDNDNNNKAKVPYLSQAVIIIMGMEMDSPFSHTHTNTVAHITSSGNIFLLLLLKNIFTLLLRAFHWLST